MFVKRRQYPLAAIGVEAVKVGVSVLWRRADRSSDPVVYVFKSGYTGDKAAAYQPGADVLHSPCLADDIRQERGTSDESLMSLFDESGQSELLVGEDFQRLLCLGEIGSGDGSALELLEPAAVSSFR